MKSCLNMTRRVYQRERSPACQARLTPPPRTGHGEPRHRAEGLAGQPPAIQGAASLVLRSGRRDETRLAGWLDEVALRGDDGSQECARSRQLAPKPAEQLEA